MREHVHSFICKYWIMLAVNTPESLLCCPTCTKFSRNHMHSLMNQIPTLEEEEEEEEEEDYSASSRGSSSQRVDMSLHSDTLFRFRDHQSFILLN